MTITQRVLTRHWNFEFTVIAHHTVSGQGRLIEREFYMDYGPEVLCDGDHYEMEIVGEIERPEGVPIHIHTNPHTGRKFVCWTNRLATIEEARTILKAWCVGTAYSLIFKEDFTPRFRGKPEEFLKKMKQDYGIRAE